jgi:ankyrin repeat protein
MIAYNIGGVMQPLPLLHFCAVQGPRGIGTKLLCAAGADLEARCENDGDVRTALMWAAGGPERIENLRALMDAGACMTSSSADSYTAFGIAAEKNNLVGVKEFIARGVDVNLRALPTMHTPLMKACKAGADVHARATGRFCGVAPLGQVLVALRALADSRVLVAV